MSVLLLKSDDVLPAGGHWALSRALLSKRKPKSLHHHDFYELIWVQNGKLRHHLEDRHEDLLEGSLLFVQPQHIHALQGRGEEAMAVSVSFSADLIDSLLARHSELNGRFFWANAPRPTRVLRDSRQMADLNRAAMLMERQTASSLAAEAFLLPLLSSLMAEQVPLPSEAPDWLMRACNAAKEPAIFRDGAAGFVRVTGRAHAHVSRTARHFLGQSPSEYINEIRMQHAARMLTGSGDSLAEIAADCGIPNLSHFHRLFLSYHKMTPAQFRRQFQTNAIQPA